MSEDVFLLGKFTHILQDKVTFRESESQDRTEDDFEILTVKIYPETEFGRQGSLFLWYGGEKDFDWDNYPHGDDWGASACFFGFQNFLEFYTSPCKHPEMRKFVLYTPCDDFTAHESVVLEEIEYSRDHDSLEIDELLIMLLSPKYRLRRVSMTEIEKYIG